MQYNVPQFVEEEAKIIGPFNIRDFFILFGAGLSSAIFFFIFQLWLAVILAFILLGGAVALLLVKINGRPLYTIIIAAMQFFWAPRLYLWRKEKLKSSELLYEKPTTKKEEVKKDATTAEASPKVLTLSQIQELARQLDAPAEELKKSIPTPKTTSGKKAEPILPIKITPAVLQSSKKSPRALTPEKIKEWAQH